MSDDITAKNAAQQRFMPVMRELARAYQAFTAYDNAGYRGTGLTGPQADVIFTLGNTDGMTFKEIGELTLITKGTLTGVIDRLEAKGLVQRIVLPEDRRCTRVELTRAGVEVFERLFPRQIRRIKERFDRLSEEEMHQAEAALRALRRAFS
ncbi:MarR family transcriptional regulator [Ectothiorhodospiraceae bacterium 2226]|nr:MarR family transcriptional regulator [Ectothiorhodospiraceae bacterium 2226]